MSALSRRAAGAYALALAVILVDQGVKYWIVGGLGLAPGSSLPVWWPMRLTLVANNGISYGFLQSSAAWMRWALAGFSVLVTIALAIWALRADKALTALAIGLIMGGAVGNLIDRVARGAVVDFVDITALHFPWVFNVADSAITVGIIVLLVENLLAPRQPDA